MKRTLPFLFSLLILSAACGGLRQAGTAPSGPRYPFPPGAVSVDGDRILTDGKPFAELRYFRSNDIIGLAIYYFGPDKEVWIFPRVGWTLKSKGKEYTAVGDIDRIWNDYLEKTHEGLRGTGDFPDDQPTRLVGGKYPDKRQILSSRITNVSISKDGKRVYYETPIVASNRVYAYEVETGWVRLKKPGER
jgi:hypothetical protein